MAQLSVPGATVTCACRDGFVQSWKMSNSNNTLAVHLYGDENPE